MEDVWENIQESNNNPRIARGHQSHHHQHQHQHQHQHHLFEEVLLRGPIQSLGDTNNNDKKIMKENQHSSIMVEDEEDKNGVFIKKDLMMTSVIGAPNYMSPFEALATNTVVSSSNSPDSSLLNPCCFPIVTNKRPMPECHHDMVEGETVVDRRHKRMLKNRESAARSRARRQAYTTELEREHAELKEENAKLRKQQEQLLLSAPAQVVPKKRTHNRSFTAPF